MRSDFPPDRKRFRLLPFLFVLFAFAPRPCAAYPPAPGMRGAGGEINRLFQSEMQQCSTKLKWHGEHLPDDTVYAAALTGLSWLDSWNKDRPYSLAWGDCGKVPALRKRTFKQNGDLIASIQQAVRDRNWQQAVQKAKENFSSAEIGCLPALKEAVGRSLLALHQPEQAYAVFAAPFDGGRTEDASEADRRFRQAAFEAAEQAAQQSESPEMYRRAATAFALSLLLQPGTENADATAESVRLLEKRGVDIDRTLLGILQSPEGLRGLAATWYAAADLLTLRATPRQLPFLMHLAQSDDVYLRADAVIGLGALAYQSRRSDAPGWQSRVTRLPIQEYGLSVGERKMINQEIKEAAESDKYRLRMAAALAWGLTGDDANIKPLEKLTKDRAYLLSPPEPRSKNPVRTIQFPVRMAAAAALARYGVTVRVEGGNFAGKELDKAKRGGQDETNDRRSLRKEAVSHIVIAPVYALLLVR